MRPGNQKLPALRVGVRRSVVSVAGAGGPNMSFFSSSSACFPPEFCGGFKEMHWILLTGAGVLRKSLSILLISRRLVL